MDEKMSISFLKKPLKVINVGLNFFAEELDKLGVETIQVNWSPPAGGDREMADLLCKMDIDEIDEANLQAVNKMIETHPMLVDVKSAIDAVPKMSKKTILHAGPPVKWVNMCGPMKGAVIGALIYEGLAEDEKAAVQLAESNEIIFAPCHHHSAVGPMAGIISSSMPVFVIQDKNNPTRFSYTNLNEGLGNVLRFGSYGKDVISKLAWLRDELAPILKDAIKKSNGIDLHNIMAQALHMGDEGHNRNIACTSLFLRQLTLQLLQTEFNKQTIRNAISFIDGNNHFFLNLNMAASKLVADAAVGIKNSTIVTTMARNGVEFGIRVSGLEGRWFTAPANVPKGLLFPRFTDDDANPDLGDSAIMETTGLGGFAMAASPAIVNFVGGKPDDAIGYTKEMGEITVTKNSKFTIPQVHFEGVPFGIDIRKVVELNIQPIIDTGVAHKKAGIGQVGAGLVRAPKDCFKKALVALNNGVT